MVAFYFYFMIIKYGSVEHEFVRKGLSPKLSRIYRKNLKSNIVLWSITKSGIRLYDLIQSGLLMLTYLRSLFDHLFSRRKEKTYDLKNLRERAEKSSSMLLFFPVSQCPTSLVTYISQEFKSRSLMFVKAQSAEAVE